MRQQPTEVVTMTQDVQAVDVAEAPDVLQLAEAVAESGAPVKLERDGEPLAVLQPVPGPRRSHRDRPLTRTDSLFDLIGIGESEGDGTGSARKHETLARVYRPAD